MRKKLDITKGGHRRPHGNYYRGTQQWRKHLREQMLAESPRCRHCGAEAPLDMHHIVPVRDPSCDLYDRNNFVLLCKSCHHEADIVVKHQLTEAERQKACRNSVATRQSRAKQKYELVREMFENCRLTWDEIAYELEMTWKQVRSIYWRKGGRFIKGSQKQVA